MKFTRFDSPETLDDAASEWIIGAMQAREKTLFCPATGNSPIGTYKKLVEKKSRIPVDRLSIIKLDEWFGLNMQDPGSCESYLQERLLKPLGFPSQRFTSFDSMTTSPEKECGRIQDWLDKNGPIDLLILGIGQNGHVAFNEPGPALDPGVHLGKLSQTSLSHTMISEVKKKLAHGLTLGMGDILRAGKILLIVNGSHKAEVLSRLMKKEVSTELPASFLWLHPDADCFHCVD